VIEDLQFAADGFVHLLWAALLVLAAAAWGLARRRQRLEVFGLDAARHAAWLTACRRRRWTHACLLAVALAFLTAAAVEPRSNPTKESIRSRGRDLAVLLDVSRSMLADDLKPSRLERAKLELQRLADRLRGDRVGLIAFAGNATVLSPLTSNYSFFKSVVRNVSPQSASQGGTKIGDAIRKALKDLFGLQSSAPAADSEHGKSGAEGGATVLASDEAPAQETYADILLITDGEDHSSYAERAAATAAEHGVGLYIVGLGSAEGSPIPIETEAGRKDLMYKGEVHRSALDSTFLQNLTLVKAERSDRTIRGAYLPAGTDNPDIADFYEKTLRAEKGREFFEEHVSWTEIFQPFLLAGFCFFLAFLALPERPPRARGVTVEAVGA
jgi:Ca-activated chloride channel family protein